MRARSGWMQIVVTAVVITAALATSTVLSGWHWGLLIPAGALVAVSAYTWRRRTPPR